MEQERGFGEKEKKYSKFMKSNHTKEQDEKDVVEGGEKPSMYST